MQTDTTDKSSLNSLEDDLSNDKNYIRLRSRKSSANSSSIKTSFTNSSTGSSNLILHHTNTTSTTSCSGSSSSSKRNRPCNFCSKVFLGLSDLQRHLRVHSGERPYECDICKKKFRQSVSLRNHIACIHDKESKYVCDYCDKSFPLKERLRLHLRKHTGEKPYVCSFCNKKFARGGQLRQHLPSHSGEKKHCCKQCNASFSTKSSLFSHRKKTHFKKCVKNLEENDIDAKSNTCRICDKQFNTEDGLKKHGATCHRHIKQFYCTICNKTLKGHLQQHLNVHDNIKLYSCSRCDTKFAQKSQLNVHERVHTGERPFVCKVCEQTFSHSYVLKTHYRKHTGEKPFKCPLCSNEVAFAQLPHLKTHMRCIHGKDKVYMCDGCHEFFKMKSELQQHTKICTEQNSIIENKTSTENISDENLNSDQQTLLTHIRLNIVIILKKISSKDRLEKLGVEKRLIDNVIMTALKCAGKKCYDDENLPEIKRLKLNIGEFLNWTLPKQIMENYERDNKSIEEIIEHLATGYKCEKNESK